MTALLLEKGKGALARLFLIHSSLDLSIQAYWDMNLNSVLGNTTELKTGSENTIWWLSVDIQLVKNEYSPNANSSAIIRKEEKINQMKNIFCQFHLCTE